MHYTAFKVCESRKVEERYFTLTSSNKERYNFNARILTCRIQFRCSFSIGCTEPEKLDNPEKRKFSVLSGVSGFVRRKRTLYFYSTCQKIRSKYLSNPVNLRYLEDSE